MVAPTAAPAELSGNPDAIHTAWLKKRRDTPELRARDLARQLGISEGELVAARLGRDGGVIRLNGDMQGMMKDMPRLGRVMCLTRNEEVVHERKGCFEDVKVGGHVGLVLGADIDLRLFLGQWKSGFLVREKTRSGHRTSLQFFGPDGIAVHKIYALPDGDGGTEAMEELALRFTDANQTPGLSVRTVPTVRLIEPPPTDPAIIEAFRAGWASLGDVHEFHDLLKTHGLTRWQALRLVDEHHARRIAPDALQAALEAAAEIGLPVMVFVSNPGCIQIHSGPVHAIKVMGPWLNVLDPDFNLHVRADLIAEIWAVRKPTNEGEITALEAFAADGRMVLQMFGARKPGQPELEAWRGLVRGIEAKTGLAA